MRANSVIPRTSRYPDDEKEDAGFLPSNIRDMILPHCCAVVVNHADPAVASDTSTFRASKAARSTSKREKMKHYASLIVATCTGRKARSNKKSHKSSADEAFTHSDCDRACDDEDYPAITVITPCGDSQVEQMLRKSQQRIILAFFSSVLLGGMFFLFIRDSQPTPKTLMVPEINDVAHIQHLIKTASLRRFSKQREHTSPIHLEVQGAFSSSSAALKRELSQSLVLTNASVGIHVEPSEAEIRWDPHNLTSLLHTKSESALLSTNSDAIIRLPRASKIRRSHRMVELRCEPYSCCVMLNHAWMMKVQWLEERVSISLESPASGHQLLIKQSARSIAPTNHSVPTLLRGTEPQLAISQSSQGSSIYPNMSISRRIHRASEITSSMHNDEDKDKPRPMAARLGTQWSDQLGEGIDYTRAEVLNRLALNHKLLQGQHSCRQRAVDIPNRGEVQNHDSNRASSTQQLSTMIHFAPTTLVQALYHHGMNDHVDDKTESRGGTSAPNNEIVSLHKLKMLWPAIVQRHDSATFELRSTALMSFFTPLWGTIPVYQHKLSIGEWSSGLLSQNQQEKNDGMASGFARWNLHKDDLESPLPKHDWPFQSTLPMITFYPSLWGTIPLQTNEISSLTWSQIHPAIYLNLSPFDTDAPNSRRAVLAPFHAMIQWIQKGCGIVQSLMLLEKLAVKIGVRPRSIHSARKSLTTTSMSKWTLSESWKTSTIPTELGVLSSLVLWEPIHDLIAVVMRSEIGKTENFEAAPV